jgi:hypothetical protein
MAHLPVYRLIFICEECESTIKIHVSAVDTNPEKLRETSFDLVCCNPSGCRWRKSNYGREAFHISPTPAEVQTTGEHYM